MKKAISFLNSSRAMFPTPPFWTYSRGGKAPGSREQRFQQSPTPGHRQGSEFIAIQVQESERNDLELVLPTIIHGHLKAEGATLRAGGAERAPGPPGLL